MKQPLSIIRVIVKTALLFGLLNMLYLVFNPLPALNRISVYNTFLPGHKRLPFSENSAKSYNITILRREGMFAAHELSGTEKADDEYRVLLFGDSGVWGWLLQPDETLSACLNQLNLTTAEGQKIQVYNLGYPILNVTKDLLLIDYALQYEPDMVVWLVTLASLFPDDQLYHEIVRQHPEAVKHLIETYHLNLDATQLPDDPTWTDRTLIGQRRELADWIRHQTYALAWAATEIDHRDPRFFRPRPESLYGNTILFNGQADDISDGTDGYVLSQDALSLDVLLAGEKMMTDSGGQMVFINEPMFQSSGGNSDLRYNYYYPRWAYDAYREVMQTFVETEHLNYVDFWDTVPNEQFTDTSFHLTPQAVCEFAVRVGDTIQNYAN